MQVVGTSASGFVYRDTGGDGPAVVLLHGAKQITHRDPDFTRGRLVQTRTSRGVVLSTHKTPAIARWQLRHPRFSFHFTPTYSSWMNLVNEHEESINEADRGAGLVALPSCCRH